MEVKDTKEEVDKVSLELQMHIVELQIKLQQPNELEVREQYEVDAKLVMNNIETIVKDCSQIFEDVMEICASLHKDPHVKKIEIEIREKQPEFDKIKLTELKLVPTQRFSHLQEGQLLQGKIDEL